MADVKTVPYVKQMVGGKYLPNSYDWINDPNGYKKDDHLPANRCYHCGLKFVGSQYAAFCNICDNAMSMGDDISLRIGDKSTGTIVMRSALVASRIRIPDDVSSEEDYKKKLEEKPQQPKTTFTRADEIYNL
jgi:hypothetical protein